MPLSAAASWRGRPSRTSAIASIRRTCAPSEHFAAKLRSSALVCSVRLIFNVTPIRSLHRANRRTRTSNRKSVAVGIPPLESRPTRAGISCWQIPDGVRDRVRSQVTSHKIAKQPDDRPGAREQADAFYLFVSILCYEDGDLHEVAVYTAVECDDISSVGILEFFHVAGHPDASECRLKDFDDCSEPPDFIAGRRQDRRMKDNVLIEGTYCSGKIAGFQCG